MARKVVASRSIAHMAVAINEVGVLSVSCSSRVRVSIENPGGLLFPPMRAMPEDDL